MCNRHTIVYAYIINTNEHMQDISIIFLQTVYADKIGNKNAHKYILENSRHCNCPCQLLLILLF